MMLIGCCRSDDRRADRVHCGADDGCYSQLLPTLQTRCYYSKKIAICTVYYCFYASLLMSSLYRWSCNVHFLLCKQCVYNILLYLMFINCSNSALVCSTVLKNGIINMFAYVGFECFKQSSYCHKTETK
jgi:hypothetical protein